MSALAVADVARKVRDLPSPSLVVTELLRSFEDPNASVTVLAQLVSRDQALTAKALRLANSSFYGLSRKIATLQQAITVLGFDSVRSLVVAAGVTENFASGRHPSFDFHMFWRHSIGVAVCSKQIAHAANLNQNYAFVCGLLHDIGRLVLVTCFPRQYGDAIAKRTEMDCHMLEAEQLVLGIDHALVGRLVCENWKFPPLIQRAIANHHVPDTGDLGDMSSVVHVANAIVHALDLVNEQHALVPEISERAWNSLKLGPSDLYRIFRNTEKEFEEACQVLVA